MAFTPFFSKLKTINRTMYSASKNTLKMIVPTYLIEKKRLTLLPNILNRESIIILDDAEFTIEKRYAKQGMIMRAR